MGGGGTDGEKERKKKTRPTQTETFSEKGTSPLPSLPLLQVPRLLAGRSRLPLRQQPFPAAAATERGTVGVAGTAALSPRADLPPPPPRFPLRRGAEGSAVRRAAPPSLWVRNSSAGKGGREGGRGTARRCLSVVGCMCLWGGVCVCVCVCEFVRARVCRGGGGGGAGVCRIADTYFTVFILLQRGVNTK